MGREVRRVPLGFNHPVGKTWGGFLRPDGLDGKKCDACAGTGSSERSRYLQDRWYGKVPFDPRETGSTPFTPETPEVRRFAERNVHNAPNFYGVGEAVVVREANRLCDECFNNSWSHHLAQADVDALVAGGRLHDFTSRHTPEKGWVPIDPPPTVTAEEVNRWSLSGCGHDSINCWIVVKAECERRGVPQQCAVCDGHGETEKYPGQRAEAEAWEPTGPPAGEWWQLWEHVSEGSPISPAFATAEELIDWMCQPVPHPRPRLEPRAFPDSPWGQGWRRDVAEPFVKEHGWAPSTMSIGGEVMSGAEAVVRLAARADAEPDTRSKTHGGE